MDPCFTCRTRGVDIIPKCKVLRSLLSVAFCQVGVTAARAWRDEGSLDFCNVGASNVAGFFGGEGSSDFCQFGLLLDADCLGAVYNPLLCAKWVCHRMLIVSGVVQDQLISAKLVCRRMYIFVGRHRIG